MSHRVVILMKRLITDVHKSISWLARTMPDRPTSIRHWTLIRTLSASRSGYTLRELAEEFGVSEKTIRRDLAAIDCAGFGLMGIDESNGRKRWRLEPSSGDLSAPVLDSVEAASLFLGRRCLDPLAGTMLWEAAQSAFAKLRQLFQPDALRYLQTLARTIHETRIGVSDYSGRADVIDDLMAGVRGSNVTRLLYHPLRTETPVSYTLYPHGIVWHRGTLYLVATYRDRIEPRHFKIDRIHDVQILDETFERPDAFDLREHLQHSFGVYQKTGPLKTVKIRFDESAARFVSEHQWHSSQRIDAQPNGSLIVHLELSDLTEVRSWIMSFGSQVTVLAPESLRNSIRDELTKVLEKYGSGRTESRPQSAEGSIV